MLAFPAFAQVELKTGAIYGQVTDNEKKPLAGVQLRLESDVMTAWTAATGANGSFRFTTLPPGVYVLYFALKGYTTVRQDNIRVSTNSEVQLRIQMAPSISEELVVIGETPFIDRTKTTSYETYNREQMNDLPNARDPWAMLVMTPGMDSNRFQWTQQGNQGQQVAHGMVVGGYIYDGVDISDPAAVGASATYYDFDAFEEIQISTSASEGAVVKMVTKRGGNKWSGNVSYFYSSEALQSSNTPQELIDLGQADKSVRLDRITEYGFDLGGPIIKDKLFAWGAYRKNDVDIFLVSNQPDNTDLRMLNLKANMDWTSEHQSMFGYFDGDKTKLGRYFNPLIQAPETAWDQKDTDTILDGIWTFQHTWIPNDRMILTARYGYIGLGFQLIPPGGKETPAILLAAIPRYENTFNYISPIDRPTHDVNVDADYFKEEWLGGDHEFKFGFSYRTSDIHTFSSYGNGQYIVDFYQTVPGGPLTAGYLYAQHDLDGKVKTNSFTLFVNDTFRKERLTLKLGVLFSHSTGKNQPSSVRGVPGFEEFVGPFSYEGGDPGIAFNTVSPQIAATYDVKGDGKTLIRGSFARFYEPFDLSLLRHTNPTYVYNGASFYYVNLNGDRTVTTDELVAGPFYYGGLSPGGFDLDAFLEKRLYDDNLKPGWANEFIVGVERELVRDLSLAVTYTHTSFGNMIDFLPFGVTSEDYVPGGTFTAETELGTFSVPYYVLGFQHDGTSIYQNVRGYERTYNGIEIVARKRMSNNFMLNGSLVLQRQKANYAEGDSNAHTAEGTVTGGGAFFPYDPGTISFLDGQPYTNSARLYSEWQFRLSGAYQLPWDFTVSGALRYQQGYPYLIAGTVIDPSLSAFLGTRRHLILVEPIGSRRYDNYFMLDLHFSKGFGLGEYGRIALIADIFNVTNANTIFDRNDSISSQLFTAIEQHLAPRSVRLGMRYSF